MALCLSRGIDRSCIRRGRRHAAPNRSRSIRASSPMTTAAAVQTEQIPVFKPLLEQEEIDASAEALRMGWLGMGSYVANFERAIQDFLEAGDRYVVAVSTGHAALHP